ncbi:MAG: flagellar biosynthetic protein FliO [Alphaproteobacteria bacterium]|nr:flagellar biosynthetic protein FliO [Alphaproteobacteria bacterium]
MDVLDWGRAVFALVATLAMIGLLALAARRLGMVQPGPPPAGRRLRVVERLMLDPRRQLALVAVDGEEHLILLSPFGDRPIAKARGRDAPAADAADESAAS